MHRQRGHGSFVIAIGIGIVLLVIILLRAGPRSEQMRRVAAPTIRAIEQYAQQHGHYPASLAATGASAPLTPYGRYQYHASEDGADCSLSVGSRFRDGFVLSWDCVRRQWSMNPVLGVAPAHLDSGVLSEPDDTAEFHEPSV